jgi:hypothetical protein
VRLPVVLLAVSLLGVIGGAWLIGRWAVGCAVIFDSLCAAVYAVWGYDDGRPAVPGVHGMGGDDGIPADVREFIARQRARQQAS